MKNFLIGLVIGVLLCGLTLLVLVFAMVRFAGSFANRPVSVADGSTLVLDLEGDVPERLPADIPIPILQNQTPLSVQQVWDTFRKAAADPRIKGILFEPHGLDIGWGKMEEIQDEIVQFKKSGKPIITYLHSPSAREYYLASATDKIFVSPEDSLDLKGLRAESLYFKDTLDKVGVKADVIHAGKYKDAGDVLTQTSMSPETREVLNAILDQYYGDLIATVAQGRKKQPDAVRALLDDGPFLARDAAANGLIDALGYEDQAVAEMQTRLKQSELKKVSSKAYLKAALASGGAGRRIALVVGDGMITQGSGNETADDESFTATGFIKLLKQVEKRSVHPGRDSTHRFSGRRRGGVRRNAARGQESQQEETAGDLDERRSRIGRLLRGRNRRSDRCLSQHAYRVHRRDFRAVQSARPLRQSRRERATPHPRPLCRH